MTIFLIYKIFEFKPIEKIIHTAGHLWRYGKLLGSALLTSPLSMILEIFGSTYYPPFVSSKSYLFASFSIIFLID